MMHNSLLIRDILRSRNHDSMAIGRRDPHRGVRIDHARHPEVGEVALEGTWCLSAVAPEAVAKALVNDVSDFLEHVGVDVDPFRGQSMEFRLDDDLPSGGFWMQVDPGHIQIAGGGAAGLWAGAVYVEREMTARCAAIVPLGLVQRTPQWEAQISQAPFGSNYLVPDLTEEFLGDDAFRLLIHYGCTGMSIYGDWLCYVSSERIAELNHPDYDANMAALNNAVARAGAYGVRLYYVAVSPKLPPDHPAWIHHPALRGSKVDPGPLRGQRTADIYCLCSSSPESLAFHGEVMANLFRQVPDLGGLILIVGGESYYHCFMRPDKQELGPEVRTNCPVCAQRNPEAVVSELLRVTATAVHGESPQAAVMAWPYSAWWSSDPVQLQLLDALPSEVTWLTTVDKDQQYNKGSYQKKIWDYSIDYTGPSDRARIQAQRCHDRNLPLAIKTETALGLECIQFPYMPALDRLYRKWMAVRSLRPQIVLQSWMFFGMWGSRAEELGWWVTWHPEMSPQEVLRTLAIRDFGADAEAFLGSWSKISEAVGHLPYIGPYFSGPEFLGPAHPLVWDSHDPALQQFYANLYYLQEHEATFAPTLTVVRHPIYYGDLPEDHLSMAMSTPSVDRWSIIIGELDRAVECACEGWNAIAKVEMGGDRSSAQMVREEQLLTELVYRTLVTTRNYAACPSCSHPSKKN